MRRYALYRVPVLVANVLRIKAKIKCAFHTYDLHIKDMSWSPEIHHAKKIVVFVWQRLQSDS